MSDEKAGFGNQITRALTWWFVHNEDAAFRVGLYLYALLFGLVALLS